MSARRAARRLAPAILAAAVACACGLPGARERGPRIVGAADAPQVAGAVHFREWRLPLDPGRLADPAAVQRFWRLASGEAGRAGGRVEPVRVPAKPARDQIVVLDTADGSLARHGLILRRRGREPRPGYTANAEFTLKSRSTDIGAAHAAPVQASSRFPSTQRFEEEIVVASAPGDSAPSLWSFEGSVRKLERDRTLTIGDLGELFPGTLGRLGPASSPLVPAGNVRVEQFETELPPIAFGAARVKPVVLVWLEVGSGAPIGAEFSLTEKLPDYWAQPAGEKAAIGAYVASLRTAARDWMPAAPPPPVVGVLR